jgi:predicted Rossmann fold nucleotide-binding protein DprA/Smf involved in DNA uptake
VHVDALARESRMELGPLLDTLLSLEMRRLVRSVPGGQYVRIAPPGTPGC